MKNCAHCNRALQRHIPTFQLKSGDFVCRRCWIESAEGARARIVDIADVPDGGEAASILDYTPAMCRDINQACDRFMESRAQLAGVDLLY